MSDSLRPHGLQPTRLLRPWDFPGKSTGVGAIAFLSKKSYAWTLIQFERKQAKEMEKVILKWKIYEF